MATHGKGRGRGRGLLGREVEGEGLPRPGGGDPAANRIPVTNGSADETIPSEQVPKPSSASSQESLSEIQSLLDNLTLDISDEDLDKILELSDQVAEDQESIKRLSEMVYSKCVSDREFAKTGAFICDKLAALEINGTKFRSSLLSLVQADYKEKDNLRSQSTSKFLNSFSMMCQIFGTMRTAGGEVFKPLVGPVFEFIMVIIDDPQCNSDEYEVLNEQLQSIGRDLELNDREKMEQLIEKIRLKIIKGNSTAQARCTLLEVVECYCRGWKNLSNDVTRFYCDTMMDILTD
ncbi:CBP80/20-dependent translation initiation factor-like [Mya arenaria]|uniref:CBP80/20-dependent translation initiation factor-like n=1 Tax=Mya arenaria TaxID=6604 RepID=UPI0022E609EB|nr:CBP80/20-dependent translation initiation factor-like [Mya arenaria]